MNFKNHPVCFGTPLLLMTSSAFSATCGMGAHWIDNCAASIETYQVEMNFGLDTDFSSLANIDATFAGSITIKNTMPYASDPANAPYHLDRIDTEILSMNLTGITPFVEGWTLRMGSTQGVEPSYGFVQELNDPATALARFDAIFEIDSLPYGTLTHNLNSSIFFETVLTRLPPTGAKFNHTGAPFGTTVPLFSTDGTEVLRFTDLIVTDFVTEGRPSFTVTTVPLPPSIWLFGTVTIGFLGLIKRKKPDAITS